MLNRIRSLVLALALATPVVLCVAPSNASAQFRIGPHIGASFDDADPLIGLDMWIGLVDITDSIELHLNPAFSWYFPGDHFTHFSFDANVPFLFLLSGTDIVAPYAAPGFAIHHRRWDWDDHPWRSDWHGSETDAAFNLIGGAMFLPQGRINPFVQFKAVLSDHSDGVFMTGVLFKI